MNDFPGDPNFSYETSPDLYLFTSLTAGSSHIITATSRMETILKANRIPFKAVDTATDEKARRIWGRRAGGKRLPGLVKEGFVLGDLEVVEEWNEFGEIKQMLGTADGTAKGGTPTPTAGEDKNTQNSVPSSAEDAVPSGDPSQLGLKRSNTTTIQDDLPIRTTAPKLTPQQMHAQLGGEVAAIAQLHKKAPKPILNPESESHISPIVSHSELPDASTEDASSTAASIEPLALGSTRSTSESAANETSGKSAPAPETALSPSVTFSESEKAALEEPVPGVPSAKSGEAAVFSTADPEKLPLLLTKSTSATIDDSTEDSIAARTTSPESGAMRTPRASVTAGDLAVSGSPPVDPQLMGLEKVGSPASSVPDVSGLSQMGSHSRSSISAANKEEVKEVEARSGIDEVDGEDERDGKGEQRGSGETTAKAGDKDPEEAAESVQD